jgi:hypothetical protein
MAVALPVRTEADNRFTIRLDDKVVGIRLLWNSRMGYWTISLYDDTGTPIVLGVKVVINYELTALFQDYLPGLITALRSSEDGRRIERFEIGDTVQLIYTPEAEIAV